MPAIRRTLKNVVKNYSDAQVKVREATSNDPWGPSSTLMSEIADLTYNVDAFNEIMPMIWKRLNDDGKNWRHVYKSLVLLDYIIKTGRDKVAQQCKENFHAVKTLTTFQYVDIDNKDQGMNVREKAKQIVAMLSDDEKLKNERAKALKAKERFAQNAMGVGNRPGGVKLRMNVRESSTQGSGPDSQASPEAPSEMENARPASVGEEELQLQLALAMSKEEHDESVRKQKSDDIKLQMALQQSREELKEKERQYQMSTPGGTLLNLAGPSGSAGAQAAATDPWGAPLPSQSAPPSDPWETRLPPPGANPDPWGTSGGSRLEAPPSYSPTMGGSASVAVPPPQSAPDPWGMPVTAPASQASAWVSTSPTSSKAPGGVDPFGASSTNGASSSNTLDNEFDLLSARSNESSPVKSSQGFEEFDILSGNTLASGATSDAWNMNGLKDGLEDNKKKSAKDFLGANANLVNLDQLVSQAPPKGNNPFAMTPEASNPFQDPNAGVRRPMAQMQPASQSQGFAQPVTSGMLPAPLLPMGSSPTMQQQPSPQQTYNPFL